MISRVHEGDHDVSGAPGGGQALVTVGEAAGVQEHPAQPRARHRAVLPHKPAAAALCSVKINVEEVEILELTS